MPTSQEDYTRRFADWQRREAAAREPKPPPPERDYASWEVLTKEDDAVQRYWWFRQEVLISVSSPTARQLLEETHLLAEKHIKMLPWKRGKRDYLLLAKKRVYSDSVHYRDWVREGLRASDLAQRLPAGLDALPDIYSAMSDPWRSIDRLWAPKTYPQLLKHLVRHLDWYIDPTQKVKPPLSEIGTAVAYLGTTAGGLCMLAGYKFWPLVGIGAAWILKFVYWIWGGHRVGRKRISQYHSFRDMINSAELYYYLADQYADISEQEIRSSELTV